MAAETLVLAACAWLLTYALHSSVLIGIAWTSSALLSRASARSRPSRGDRHFGSLAAVRERLWKLALVGGIATATVQTALGGGPFGLVAEPEAAAPSGAAEHVVTLPLKSSELPAGVVPVLHDPTSFVRPTDASLERWDGADRPQRAPLAGPALDRTPLESGSSTITLSVSPPWTRVILAVWIAGVAFGLARWTLDWRRLVAALRGRATIARGTAREVFDALVERAGVGSHVRLLHAPRIAAPITIGLLRPAICLPPRAAAELQRDELEALLAHELAHALRRDPAWLCACRAIEVALFFQPLNRLARIHLSDEAEYLCDDWAVRHTRERLSLASCLTEIAGWIVGRERELTAPGMAGRGSRLELRVRRLLAAGDPSDVGANAADELPDARLPRWMTPLACGTFAAVALFVPGVSAKSTGAGLGDWQARGELLSEGDERDGDGAPDDSEAGDPESPAGDRSDRESMFSELYDEQDTMDSRSDQAALATLLALQVQGFAPGSTAPMLVGAARELELANAPSVDAPQPDACSENAASEAASRDRASTALIARDQQPSPPAPCETQPSALTVRESQPRPPGADARENKSGKPGAHAQKASAPAAPELWPNAPFAPDTTGPLTSETPALIVPSDALVRALSAAEGSATASYGAPATFDARAFDAELEALGQTLRALKTELSRRRAPAELGRRVKGLEDELRTLNKRRTALVRLMSSAAARAAVPNGAQAHDQLTTQDRK